MRLPGPVRRSEPVKAAGRVLRIVVITLLVIGFVPLLSVTGARLTGGDTDWTAQAAPFAPIAAVGWALALIMLLLLRSWWLAAFAGLLLGVHLAWMAPAVLARLSANPVPDGTPIRVLTINAQFGGADVGELARLVHSDSIDLVAVQEMTEEFETRFSAAAGAQLPHHVAYPAGNLAGGSGIWSRWDLSSEGRLPSQYAIPKVRAVVPGVGEIQVIGVHTLSPIAGRVPGWRADLAMLAHQARAGSGPQLMLGDFNASRDHAPFREVLSGPLADAAETSVLVPWRVLTWPTDRRYTPPLVRIDHVLMSRHDFSAIRVRSVRIRGTDHEAVLADLVVRATTGSAA